MRLLATGVLRGTKSYEGEALSPSFYLDARQLCELGEDYGAPVDP